MSDRLDVTAHHEAAHRIAWAPTRVHPPGVEPSQDGVQDRSLPDLLRVQLRQHLHEEHVCTTCELVR